MSDLRVERYDAEEVAAKKQSISKRVATVGGAVVLTLGLLGLAGCTDREEEEYVPAVGGAGAWFISDLEYLEDLEDLEKEYE